MEVYEVELMSWLHSGIMYGVRDSLRLSVLQMRNLRLKDTELVSREAEVRSSVCLMISPRLPSLPQALLFIETA